MLIDWVAHRCARFLARSLLPPYPLARLPASAYARRNQPVSTEPRVVARLGAVSLLASDESRGDRSLLGRALLKRRLGYGTVGGLIAWLARTPAANEPKRGARGSRYLREPRHETEDEAEDRAQTPEKEAADNPPQQRGACELDRCANCPDLAVGPGSERKHGSRDAVHLRLLFLFVRVHP